MKKILAGIGILLAVAAGVVLVLAAMKPDVFSMQRSASIKAPPERIAGILSDFRAWKAWSPWEKLDPALKRSYSGADKGKGAIYAWQGNQDVGEGRMEITEATSSRVALNLDFVTPFEAHNKVVFTLVPKGELTEVTWSMQGPLPSVAKVVHVVFNMDAMVGKQFEAGLADLKAVAEK